ncbi:MAG: class II glutamine amidotransferase [Candidatus Omnitrophica bacterium]|nr:class II glutamine amidotransferase [Candidatus Omnitrophota bacterium]
MCELFGMSSRYPAVVGLSLKTFGSHWKIPPRKLDGWGISFSLGKDALLAKEPFPVKKSPMFHFFENHRCRSSIVISHLRRAGPGLGRTYENTQPFARELYGRNFIFAHHGLVKRIFHIKHIKRFKINDGRPLGSTDSEHAFYFLLERLKEELGPKGIRNPLEVRKLLNRYAVEITSLGMFNFLMSDSENLYAFRSHKLYFAQRECMTASRCLVGGPLTVQLAPAILAKRQRVVLIATMPLSKHKCWKLLPCGRVVVFYKGSERTGPN